MTQGLIRPTSIFFFFFFKLGAIFPINILGDVWRAALINKSKIDGKTCPRFI